MKWVTRERPKTDRIACPWLILNCIDPEAEILYVPASEVLEVAEREAALSFDAPGARFDHRDGLCTFEVLLDELALALARIVHGADIADDRDATPQSRGLLAVAEGFYLLELDDHRQLELSLPVYDAVRVVPKRDLVDGLSRDAHIIFSAQALRAFAYGVGSIALGVGLADAGLDSAKVGTCRPTSFWRRSRWHRIWPRRSRCSSRALRSARWTCPLDSVCDGARRP